MRVFEKLSNKSWIKKNSHLLIKVKTEYGYLNLLKNDQFITSSFIKGEYWAKNELKTIVDFLNFKKKDELVYFDVGSNIGSHVLAISKIFNSKVKIFCFEPQSFIFKILQSNIYENNLQNVVSFNKAISDKKQILNIKVPNYTEYNNFGGLELIKAKFSDNHLINFSNINEEVETIPLDNFINHKVDFIKMDIEGMENLGINGGIELIKKHRPFLIIELKKTDLDFMLSFFKNSDYSAYLSSDGNGLFVPNELGIMVKNLKKII